jgi:hypothetical protein
MKPIYRETSYNTPGRIVTILLFVITFMSFALNSVPAKCANTSYHIWTFLRGCQGCDLNSHPARDLNLGGPLPVFPNTIESYTDGSYTFPDVLNPHLYGTLITEEYAKAIAYAFYGRLGMSLSSSAKLSPQSMEFCFGTCAQIQTPAVLESWAQAQIGFTEVLTVNFPGVPFGTEVNFKFSTVWEGAFNTTDPDISAYFTIFITDPCSSKPWITDYEAPGSFHGGNFVSGSIPNGSSCLFSIKLFGLSQSLAGWVLENGTQFLPSHAGGLTAMSTFAYYIDVLTPGASYYTESGTIYPTSDSVHLDINPTGTGSGSIKSSPSGIDCGPTCSAYYPPGSTVMLTATPAADGSIFSGWSDNPDCTDGSVFMATTKSCTGTFDLCPGTTRASVGSTNYDSISLAYGGVATNGDTIKVLASNQQEGPIDFHSGKSVALIGGYDCLLNNIVSYTVVTGSITISTGDVTIAGIRIQ